MGKKEGKFRCLVESEDDLNVTLLQTYFGATLPLKVGHRTKDKKEKVNKYL